MALSLKDQETDSLARQVANLTGESLTEAVRGALRLRLRDEQLKRGKQPVGRRRNRRDHRAVQGAARAGRSHR